MILIMGMLFQTGDSSDCKKKSEERDREGGSGREREVREAENDNDLASGFELAGAWVVFECALCKCTGHLAKGVVKFLLGFH